MKPIESQTDKPDLGPKLTAYDTLRQKLLVANLWVIFGTISISLLLVTPFAGDMLRVTIAGFMPYLLTNILSIWLARNGYLRLSLLGFSSVLVVMHGMTFLILGRVPTHMMLAMVNFILLHGVALGVTSALVMTAFCVVVGAGSQLLNQNFAPLIEEFLRLSNIETPKLAWETEVISLVTTTVSTGFVVATTLRLQNTTRDELYRALGLLSEAKKDLENRSRNAEAIGGLGGQLAIATTQEQAWTAALSTIEDELDSSDIAWGDQKQGETSPAQICFSGPDGTRCILLNPHANASEVLFAQTVRDLHDGAVARIRSEERLATAFRMEGVGRLAASVAHDFNNFLVPVKASIDLFCEQEELSPGSLQTAKTGQVAVAKATALIKKLLSQTGATSSDGQEQLVDLDQCILAAEPLMRTYLPHGIEIEFDLSSKDAVVPIDTLSMEQILLNLITNSRNAMGDSGSIVVRSERLGPTVHLFVEDSGPGIPEEQREWVTVPFHTTNSGERDSVWRQSRGL